MRANLGFTLIELLVTIATIAIVMTFAAPSFVQFMNNNRLSGSSSDMVADFAFVKAEAARRGMRVVLCASSDGKSCNTNDWDKGWMVFTDADADILTIADAEILRTHPALTSGMTFVARTDNPAKDIVKAIAFRPTGQVIPPVVLTLCKPAYAERTINVTATGRFFARKDESKPCP